MHGTNGLSEDVVRRCIGSGVTKVNVNKLVLGESLEWVKERAGKETLTVVMEGTVERVKGLMERWMDVCGSSGKG